MAESESNRRFEVCPASELGPGERKLVEFDGISMGVFNVDGEYHALNNVCPHQLAPLCTGPVTGTTEAPEVGEYEWVREGEIVRCPWHGWEFEIDSGESLFNPHIRARTFETDVETTGDEIDEAGADDTDADVPECALDETEQEELKEFGTPLAGDEPPVETYDVEVEEETVVVYL